VSGTTVLPPVGVAAFGVVPALVPDRLDEEALDVGEDPPTVDVVAAAADEVASVAACELVLV
jgi:hypothetical protein